MLRERQPETFRDRKRWAGVSDAEPWLRVGASPAVAHGPLSGVWGSGSHQHLCPTGQRVNEAGRQGVIPGGVVERTAPLSFGGIWYSSAPLPAPPISALSPPRAASSLEVGC